HEAEEGILSWPLSSASSSSLLSSSCTFGCNRLVLFANSIVALTASMSGFQYLIGPSMLCPPSCLLEYPPSAYDSSPNRCPCCCCSFALCCLHRLHEKRKCAIDSMHPQSHAAVSVALILYRYLLRNVLPVRSCVRMAASVLFSCRYISANLPRWNAASIFCVNFPVSAHFGGGGPAITLALFNASRVRYHGSPSRCSGCSLSSFVAAFASLLARLFPLIPAYPGI
ncbi:uncharacterized protein BDZ99DRAFT_532904, partial [Mytilinidion resinicola]